MERRLVDPLYGAFGGLLLGVDLALFGDVLSRGDWLWDPIVRAVGLDDLFATSLTAGFAAVLVGGAVLGTLLGPVARVLKPEGAR